MNNPASELIALADELDGWHDCADGDVNAGNGHFRLQCISDSDQQRLNLRAVLREASKALRTAANQSSERAGVDAPFQSRVRPWMMACFGPEISADRSERNHRFLEEAIELVQSLGCTQSEAHQLVDYVYGRPEGEPNQEVGGVVVTLAALCLANDLDMAAAGETELARIWTKVEKIRAKQAAKPKHSPLPEAIATPPAQPAPGVNMCNATLSLDISGGHNTIDTGCADLSSPLSNMTITIRPSEAPSTHGKPDGAVREALEPFASYQMVTVGFNGAVSTTDLKDCTWVAGFTGPQPEFRHFEAARAALSPKIAAADDVETCIACNIAFVEGDMVYPDASGGSIHASCCGPERESYVNADGESLKDGDPLPTPQRWTSATAETSPGDVLAMKEACKRIALDHTPAKFEGTLAAHVTGMNIVKAIDRLDVKAD